VESRFEALLRRQMYAVVNKEVVTLAREANSFRMEREGEKTIIHGQIAQSPGGTKHDMEKSSKVVLDPREAVEIEEKLRRGPYSCRD